MIEVSEIYAAHQGEGVNLGRPSLFVRMRRCTLHCIWCDTKFSWDKNDPGFHEPYLTYNAPPPFAQDIIKHLERPPFVPEAIVFTGGEPLIYQRHLPEVIDLVRGVHPIAIEFETAGTIVPTHDMLTRRVHFNVSPKLASSHNDNVPQRILWNERATKEFLLNHAIFKIVVAKDDIPTLEYYLSWLQEVAHKVLGPNAHWQKRVYLMPCATTPGALEVGQRFVLEHAARLGVRATTRMHVTAFGNERGK